MYPRNDAIRCWVLIALMSLSASELCERVTILTNVNCTLGSASNETISGSCDLKWQFFQSSCPNDVLLKVAFTDVQLCNKDESNYQHALVRIDRKLKNGSSDQLVDVESTNDVYSYELRNYSQVDLYATIKSSHLKENCRFIVKFNYRFTSATAKTTTTTTTLPTTTTTTTTTTLPTTTTASATLTTETLSATTTTRQSFTTLGDITAVDHSKTRPTDDKQQTSCRPTYLTTIAILLGTLLGVSIAGLLYLILRYRRLKANQQGECRPTSPTGAGLEMNPAESAETKANEIYNMQ